MNELLRCKCGGLIMSSGDIHGWSVSCMACGKSTPYFPTYEQARKAWDGQPEEEETQLTFDELTREDV